MSAAPYVPLRVFSSFTMLEGAIEPKAIAKQAKKLGFPAIALMEDIALSRRLRRLSRPACLHERVLTSGRRWERHGTLRTIVLMWRVRLMYALGTPPEHLARLYRGAEPPP